MSGSRGPPKADAWKDDPVLREVVARISDSIGSGEIAGTLDLQNLKLDLLKDKGLRSVPTNSMVLDYISEVRPDLRERALPLLRRKPARTISGVAVVAVMTSPWACPHGRCIFCPGGPDQGSPSPQSYTGKEPAAMRGAQHAFDPFLQTLNRIEQLESIGHDTDKIDLIVMGGTVTCRPLDYQEGFVKGCLDAMNGLVSLDLYEAQRLNERAPHRCIGMTFETRPDRCSEQEVSTMLRLGGTRVELGFQSAFDPVLEASGRGHSVSDSVGATRRLKDAGMKVCYHLMPGMPGSNPSMDLETARTVFSDERFRPDMLKVYPTLVIAGTGLYDQWKQGRYEPYDTETASSVVAGIMALAPPWVRIQRVQRDIPSPLVEAGVRNSNLRQIAEGELEGTGGHCRCIRCREVGRNGALPDPGSALLHRMDYLASSGVETFLSFDTPGDDLIGFLRLRRPSDEDVALVRELKVFGPMAPIGSRRARDWQHKGFGRRLLSEAERISKEEMGLRSIAVNSGIGVRGYYRRLGYGLQGWHMVKSL
jgi:elongator complex protein 3